MLDSLKLSLSRRILFFILLFWAAAASFNGFYAKNKFLEGNDTRRDFAAIINGTADRPFVYRNLLPYIANLSDRVTPHAVKDKLANARSGLNEPFYQVLFESSQALDPQYSFRYLILYTETFLCTLGAVCLMYLFCRSEGIQPLAAVAASSLLILLIPYFMVEGGGNYYDYSELFFLTLGIWMARQFDWWWLIPVAALGTWNKESFLLYILTLYPLFRRRSSRLSSLFGTGVLAGISAGVYLLLRTRFHANPGGTVENHLHEHLVYFLHPLSFVTRIGKAYGIFMLRAYTVIPMTLIAWLLWREWHKLSSEMRWQARFAAVINIPLYYLFCNVGEVRDLSMLYMLLLLSLGFGFERGTLALAPEPVAEERELVAMHH